MQWTKEELTEMSKERLIDIILNFQEDYEKDFFPGLAQEGDVEY